MKKTMIYVTLFAIGVSVAVFYAFKAPSEEGKYVTFIIKCSGNDGSPKSAEVFNSNGKIESVKFNDGNDFNKLFEKYDKEGYHLVNSTTAVLSSHYILSK